MQVILGIGIIGYFKGLFTYLKIILNYAHFFLQKLIALYAQIMRKSENFEPKIWSFRGNPNQSWVKPDLLLAQAFVKTASLVGF